MKRMRNQVLLPMNLEVKIAANDPVRKLIEICEELDYTKLYDQYAYRKVKKDGFHHPLRKCRQNTGGFPHFGGFSHFYMKKAVARSIP